MYFILLDSSSVKKSSTDSSLFKPVTLGCYPVVLPFLACTLWQIEAYRKSTIRKKKRGGKDQDAFHGTWALSPRLLYTTELCSQVRQFAVSCMRLSSFLIHFLYREKREFCTQTTAMKTLSCNVRNTFSKQSTWLMHSILWYPKGVLCSTVAILEGFSVIFKI